MKVIFRVGTVALVVENKEQYNELMRRYGHLTVKDALREIVKYHCKVVA